MKEILSLAALAALFVIFGFFFRKGRLRSCAGESCETRAAGGCGCHESEHLETETDHPVSDASAHR